MGSAVSAWLVFQGNFQLELNLWTSTEIKHIQPTICSPRLEPPRAGLKQTQLPLSPRTLSLLEFFFLHLSISLEVVDGGEQKFSAAAWALTQSWSQGCSQPPANHRAGAVLLSSGFWRMWADLLPQLVYEIGWNTV